jgi:DNA polymerase I-like protein with 3'-5' exonuclease and polymerase domains
MIKVYTRFPTQLDRTSFEDFAVWLKSQTEYQFDIETTVTDHWCTKEVRTLQFGTIDGSLQYVLEWDILDDAEKAIIKESLEAWNICKLIHYVTFEYVVMRFHGMEIHNVYDTMLAEKVLNGGIENDDVALSDLVWQYRQIVLDKTYQTRFGDTILTDKHFVYAADDTVHLGPIREYQKQKLIDVEMESVVALENRTVLGLADMVYYGMGMDSERWIANIDIAQPIIDREREELEQQILNDPKMSPIAYKLGYLSDVDRPVFNMRSPVQKKLILAWVFEGINGSSRLVLKKYMADHGASLGNELLGLLIDLGEGSTDSLAAHVIKYHRDKLIEADLVIPAGTFNINWNSPDQMLPLFRAIAPRLRSTKKEFLIKVIHPVVEHYLEFKETLKLKTTYGEKFLEKYIEPDGKVRTSFNQIVSTGRTSSAAPNMQNIPAKESVGNRYRNCFIWDEGFVFVDSDFVGQELCLIADIAKDEVWFEAIKKGWDLHSVVAEMVFKGKWHVATEPGCAYAASKQKCNCKGHKRLRTGVKTINFGLAYGMSAMKLSSEMQITKQEAQQLIDEYFRAFPKIKRVLDFLGIFGVTHGYIKTIAPYYRRRWFPNWQYVRNQVESHIKGVTYNTTLGSIERASKNQPIQGSGANCTKQAVADTYEWIRHNNYVDRVNMVMNVHDQLTTVCKRDLADMWNPQLDKLMVAAGKVIVTSGILKAETNTTDVWTK